MVGTDDIPDDFAKLYRDSEGRQVLVYVECAEPAALHFMFHVGWALADFKVEGDDPDKMFDRFQELTKETVLRTVDSLREELNVN